VTARRSSTRQDIPLLLVAAIVATTALCTGQATASPHRPHHRPPSLRQVRISTHHLPSTGGHVRISGAVHDARRCRLRIRPALPHGPFVKACHGNSVHWRVRVPPNDVAHIEVYRIAVVAIGHRRTAATVIERRRVTAVRRGPLATTAIR